MGNKTLQHTRILKCTYTQFLLQPKLKNLLERRILVVSHDYTKTSQKNLYH